MPYFKSILKLCLLLTVLFPSISFSASVKGVIADSLSSEGMFYSNVYIVTHDSNATTIAHGTSAKDGAFLLEEIPAGDYQFKAKYIGYRPISIPVTVKSSDKIIDMDTLLLAPQDAMMEKVSIVARKPVFAIEGEKTLYNVSQDPTVQTGTASDALQNAPGVEVDIEGNITLRGVSSVDIWINDKPSRLSAENLKTYIQQLPANALERIEVITNPSAKYSAKGTGGIINLVMNGNVMRSSFTSFGLHGATEPYFRPWVSYVWSDDKLSFSVYGSGGINEWSSKSHGYSIMLDESLDTSNYSRYTSENISNRYSGNFYLNASYDSDTMNSMWLWLGSYTGISDYESTNDNFRQEYLYMPDIYQYNTQSNSDNMYLGGYTGMGYQHKFDSEGHKISFDFGGHTNKSNNEQDYHRDYEAHDEMDRNKMTDGDHSSYGLWSSVDYTIPYIEGGEISLGLNAGFDESSRRDSQDTLLVNTDNTYILDSLRLYDGTGYEKEFSSYATIRQKFGDFTAKLGLRAEYEYVRAEIYNAPEYDFKKDYWGLFPSLHLSYRTNSMHNFNISYTRRVSNPNDYDLNPFMDYGEDSYSMGNTELKSTFTNSLEGGWTKFFQQFGSVGLSLYYRNSTNEINHLSDVAYSDVFGRIVSFSMPVNSGKSFSTGASMHSSYRLKDFMNIRLYTNLYYSETETDFRDGRLVVADNLGYSMRLRFWAKLWGWLETHSSAHYRSKNLTIFSERKPTYSIDLGLRADFFDRKLSVHVNVNDVFNWMRRESSNNNPYYISYSSNKYVSRYISAGITFRFGNLELENKVQKGGGGEGGGQGGAGE